MRIGFDASDLCTNRADGTTRYTKEMLGRLLNIGIAHDWQIYASCKERNIGARNKNTKWISSQWPKYWTQTRLPIDLCRYRPDVMFMPIQQIPYVRPQKTRMVAVVHDLAVHLYPEQFTYKDWLLLHVFSAYAARRAEVIIAISEATATDIERYYGRTKNIHVVYHGVNHDVFYSAEKAEENNKELLLKINNKKIKKPYLLFVGQLQPRKNLTALIEAYERIWRKERRLSLVVAGSHGWLNDKIYERVKRSPAKDNIVLTGRVSDDDLRRLYWQAEVFVLPSLYEGFGLPVLEAMACGCPVVTTNVSSLPEVAGDAACLFNPADIKELVAKINEAMDRRDELIKRGLERASKFTWEKTARLTLEAIESAGLQNRVNTIHAKPSSRYGIDFDKDCDR